MPDLTTLSTVKNLAGLPSAAGPLDTVLQELITATSADFLREIERIDLMSAEYTEMRTGDGSPRLILRHWPITAVSSLNIAGTALPAVAGSNTSGWYLDTGTDPERSFVLYLSFGNSFTDGAQIAITYTAGYDDVPEDISLAVAEWVLFRNSKRQSTGMTEQRSVEGERTTADPNAMPPNTQRVIERYMRHWPGYGRATTTASNPPPPAVEAGQANHRRAVRG